MIELPILNYDYDEEAHGYDAPAMAPPPPRPVAEYIGWGMLAVGTLMLLLAVLGIGLPDEMTEPVDPGQRRTVWMMFTASFGLLIVGGIVTYVVRYAGTSEGIKHDGNTFNDAQTRGIIGWALGVFLTGFYIVLYWNREVTHALGDINLFAGAIRLLDPLSMALRGTAADQWFLYGFLYTTLVVVFGVRMVMKYRHSRYQLIRTGSVMFFQLGFAFLLPGILVAANQPEFYFSYFWPLKPDYAWPAAAAASDGYLWNGGTTIAQFDAVIVTVGTLMLGFGLFATLVLTPVLTYFFGKRWYCSWVCGCGGLAETFGDPWRQLSDKGQTSWWIERVLIHGVLLFIIFTTAVLWIDHMAGNAIMSAGFASTLKKVYIFLIVNSFAGVVGVGFYPLLGNRVWCRFGCPMAAILGLLQRYFSRFRITANGDQCMSCGNCSTYCEMGIDVRAYAQRGENIVRASCVGCGVCAAVCPRGVLKLENGPTTNRYENQSGPLTQFIHDLTNKPNKHGMRFERK